MKNEIFGGRTPSGRKITIAPSAKYTLAPSHSFLPSIHLSIHSSIHPAHHLTRRPHQARLFKKRTPFLRGRLTILRCKTLAKGYKIFPGTYKRRNGAVFYHFHFHSFCWLPYSSDAQTGYQWWPIYSWHDSNSHSAVQALGQKEIRIMRVT